MRRRDFFKIMGIASGAALSACNAGRADEKLLPYLVPPEDGVIPGVARYLRSTCMECPAHCGVEVTIRDDQPVKLEGNPDHPVNSGALCLRGQASLTRLYHPDRFKGPMLRDADGVLRPISWETALEKLQSAWKESEKANLNSVYLSSRTTGTVDRLIDDFCGRAGIERLREVEIYNHNTIREANRRVFGFPLVPHYRIDRSDMLVTLGADILGTFISPVEWTRQWRAARAGNGDFRWYHVEPYLTTTGASADFRPGINPGSEPYLAAYLLHGVAHRRPLPAGLKARVPHQPVETVASLTGIDVGVLRDMARDLGRAKRPLIISGGPCLSNVNGLLTAMYTSLLQWVLGMAGETVDFHRVVNDIRVGSMRDLAVFGDRCEAGRIGVAFFSRLHGFGTLPLLVKTMKKARFKVAMAELPGPVSDICDLVLPLSHFLESWGDAEPRKGLQCLVQPAIHPLHDTKSEGDILLALMGVKPPYRDYLREQWGGINESLINQGFRTEGVDTWPVEPEKEIKLPVAAAPYRKPCLYIIPSQRTYDGRSSGTSLSAEIPEPLSSVSYGHYVGMSGADARAHGLLGGGMVEINGSMGKTLLPAVPLPGLPGGVMTVTIDGLSATDMQVELKSGELMFCLEGVVVNAAGAVKPSLMPIRLSGTQRPERPGILPQDQNGDHTQQHKHQSKHQSKHQAYSLYPPHEHGDYRWGMVIDLDACTGCSACVAACYIENNVPVVGRGGHERGREMSWLRIESYYSGADGAGVPEFIPMLCQHCDHAPCEPVCPVYAVYHTDEGLNAQVYNRCVGTRYCANNCPYKARRFNWFDHAHQTPLYGVSNPVLSVRPKGVMEKCSFCIQRIREARDRALDGKRKILDGEVVPACAQTCPAGAVVFGNLLDATSRVSRLLRESASRVYRIHEMLGTRPAIYYLKSLKEHNKQSQVPLSKSFSGGPGGRFFKKAPLAAGGIKHEPFSSH